MQTDFARFSYSPRIFWFREILSKNQTGAPNENIVQNRLKIELLNVF